MFVSDHHTTPNSSVTDYNTDDKALISINTNPYNMAPTNLQKQLDSKKGWFTKCGLKVNQNNSLI